MTCIMLPLAQAVEAQETLTIGGAAIMLVSVALVLGLNVFCFWRIFRERQPTEHHHAPLEINTRDLET
jgi:heme/copper-type cytochrome/quinol oxidase subunit 2